jgi:hypothetical protein
VGNWWVDETPWPGPAASPTWEEITSAWRSLSSGVAINFDYLSSAIARFGEALKVELPPFILHTRKPWEDMTIDERMEYALNCRKNRNTGPRPEWQFSRAGRKDY